MPLDDAIMLIGRSFEKYVEGLREKAKAAATPLVATAAPISTRVFLPASAEVAYLLNLLADNRALTVDELNTVIKYLQERRDKLIDAESRPIVTDDGLIKPIPVQQRSEAPEVPTPATSAESAQQALKNKILSIFSNAGGSIQGVPPANGATQLPSGTPAPAPPPPTPAAPSSASLINFDNPNVQKALDNLIQSSPNLLKNITTKVSTPQMSAQNATPTTPSVGPTGAYSQPGGMMPSMMQGNQNQGQIRPQSGYGDFQGHMGMQGPPPAGYHVHGFQGMGRGGGPPPPRY